MKVSLRTAALLGTLLLPFVLRAQNTPSASLLVLSKQNHNLAIVDSISLQIVAKVPVGNDPHEVIASEPRRTSRTMASERITASGH
jgi:hypothetical protein